MTRGGRRADPPVVDSALLISGGGSVSRSVWRVGVIVAGGLAGFGSAALSRVLWPAPAGMPGPPSGLQMWFVLLSVAESAAFGAGVVFLLTGPGRLRRLAGDRRLAWAAYVSIAWLLASWWPHDNLHRTVAHDDWSGLLGVEYGFHLTLIAAGVITAVFFRHALAPPGTGDHPAATPTSATASPARLQR